MFENSYREHYVYLMYLASKITNLSPEYLEAAYRSNGSTFALAEICKNAKDLVTVDEMNTAISNALDAHTAAVEATVTAALDAHTAAVEAAIAAAIDAHLAAEHDDVG